jgi:hypothetical protein
MLYREIIAVCSEIHTKHINTLCGQNAEFVNVKPDGKYSNHGDVVNRNKSGVWVGSKLRSVTSLVKLTPHSVHLERWRLSVSEYTGRPTHPTNRALPFKRKSALKWKHFRQLSNTLIDLLCTWQIRPLIPLLDISKAPTSENKTLAVSIKSLPICSSCANRALIRL